MAVLFHNTKIDYRLLATDISPSNIAKAVSGRLSVEQAGRIPLSSSLWELQEEQTVQLSADILQRIRFQVDDLLNSQVSGFFDLIVCRNVLIYMSTEERLRVLELFRQRLLPGGLLVLGYAEALQGVSQHFHALGNHAIFQKRERPAQTVVQEEDSTSLPPSACLSSALKAYGAGDLELAQKLFRKSLENEPSPQISHFFLTLLAIELETDRVVLEHLERVKNELDFSDSVSRDVLLRHGVSKEAIQRTVDKLVKRYGGKE